MGKSYFPSSLCHAVKFEILYSLYIYALFIVLFFYIKIFSLTAEANVKKMIADSSITVSDVR